MLIRRDFNSLGRVNELQSRRTPLSGIIRLYMEMLHLPYLYGWVSWRRFQAYADAGNKLHRAFAAANGEHWRIDAVCTDPTLQGEDVGIC